MTPNDVCVHPLAWALQDIAPSLDKAHARRVLREAADLSVALGPLASAMLELDSDFARALFARHRAMADGRSDDVQTAFAYYHRTLDPADSRLRLELAFATAARTGLRPTQALTSIVLAMAPLDFERALAMADAVQGREGHEITRKLVQYLMATDDIRRAIPLDRWSEPDNWMPGTPVRWQ